MSTKPNTRLSIRASESQKMILSQAARARHMNTSQFVLQVSLDAADAVLRDQTVFTPSTLFHITIGVPSVII